MVDLGCLLFSTANMSKLLRANGGKAKTEVEPPKALKLSQNPLEWRSHLAGHIKLRHPLLSDLTHLNQGNSSELISSANLRSKAHRQTSVLPQISDSITA